MSELNTKINELRTLKKSYSDLADVASNGAKESTLLAESEAIKQVIAEVKPNVDLSGVALLGENAEATNSKIYESLGDIVTALSTINNTLGIL